MRKQRRRRKKKRRAEKREWTEGQRERRFRRVVTNFKLPYPTHLHV